MFPTWSVALQNGRKAWICSVETTATIATVKTCPQGTGEGVNIVRIRDR